MIKVYGSISKTVVICIICSLLTVTLSGETQKFTDITPDHWAYIAVMKLVEKGLISGYPDGTFKGNQPISRYEIALMIYKLLVYLEEKNNIKTTTNDFGGIVDQVLIKSTLTKEEIKLIRDLIEEFRNEIIAFEEQFKNLEKRVEKLENDKTPLVFSILSFVISLIVLLIVVV